MPEFRTRRVYDPPEDGDGMRVLVDRLWPRGLRREDAALDLWPRDVAPSPELRTWWDHDAARFDDFRMRYEAELDGNPAVDELRAAVEQAERVTLLFAARDPEVNHAVVLAAYLAPPRVS